jgi:hypothetical protein
MLMVGHKMQRMTSILNFLEQCHKDSEWFEDLKTWVEDLRSCKGKVGWPEEELEDLACDDTCAVVQRYWECVI